MFAVWLLVFSFSGVVKADSTVVPGRLIVEFTQGTLPITVTEQNGKIVTGIAWLDTISVHYGLLEMKPVYPRPMSPGLAAWYRLFFPNDAPVASLADTFAGKPEVAYAGTSSYLIPD